MKKITLLFCALLAALLSFSQEKALEPFTGIDVFGPFQIELIASNREAIEMEAVNVDKNDLVVEVHRGKLELKLKSRHFLTDWDSDKFKKSQYILTKIYFKQLDEIQACAGAKISSNQSLRSKRFEVFGSMGAEIKLSLVTETMYAKTSMGSTLNLNGRTDFLDVKASMGGVLRASRLESKSAYVKASMGSEVSIFASKEIDINANMGADVKYSGDPSVRHTNRKLGGEISKR